MPSPKPTALRLRRVLILGGTGLLLLAAVGLQLSAGGETGPVRSPSFLANLIPSSLTGWQGRELPLAETEELRNAVADTLQFDEHVSREYTKAGRRISIYIAYWQPNKVPPRSVGVHTPDTCWIQNGWTCSERIQRVPLSSASTPLQPAENGIYHFGGTTQHVLFWHLVGGETYSYEQSGLHDIWAPLRDLKTFGLNQKKEQFFIRLSADAPWDRIWHDPGVRELIGSLETLLATNP